MTEIEKEFDQLLERIDPAELDMYLPIAIQEMSVELLGIVSDPADDTSGTLGWHPVTERVGNCMQGVTCARGPPISYYNGQLLRKEFTWTLSR